MSGTAEKTRRIPRETSRFGRWTRFLPALIAALVLLPIAAHFAVRVWTRPKSPPVVVETRSLPAGAVATGVTLDGDRAAIAAGPAGLLVVTLDAASMSAR